MAIEDFGTYTEEDEDDGITVTSDKVSYDLHQQKERYLYKDFGVDHFTDFEHLVTLYFASGGNFLCNIIGWAMSNILDDLRGIYGASGDFICIIFQSSLLYLYECDGGTFYTDSYNLNEDTPYYLTFEKSGTAFTCKIYSDSARTNLVDTLELTLHSDYNFRYLYGCNTWKDGEDRGGSGYTEDLDLQEVVAEELPVAGKGRIAWTP